MRPAADEHPTHREGLPPADERSQTRARQAWYASYIEVTGQIPWVTNPSGEMVEDPPAWRAFTGQSEEEVRGSGWAKALHPDDIGRTFELVHQAIEAKTRFEADYRLRRHDGVYRHMLARGVPVLNPDESVQAWVGVCIDITERKQIENTQLFLTQCGWAAGGEDVFQSLARHVSESLGMEYVCIDRLEGDSLSAWTVAVYYDGEFQDNVTYTLKDTPCGDVVEKQVCCFPRGVRHLFPKDLVLQEMKAESYVGTVLRDLRGQAIGLIAAIGRQPLGNQRQAETIVQLVGLRAAGELERKRAEERLREAQKLESIGVLAAGVAHDFNNLLVGIIGNADLASEMLPPGHEVSELLARVLQSGDRAAHLVKQLLAFSGKGQLSVEPVNVSELVEETTGLLKPSVPKHITLQFNLERELPPVEADRRQIQQIYMDLVLNAAEAIGDRAGTISFKTGVEDVDEARRRAEPDYAHLAPGRYVFLQVRDTGPGMDEATKTRIFDPFFTTKFLGRGLGLAAVFGIVRGHRGAIKVTTAAGNGACFRVLIPAANSGPGCRC